MSSGKLIAVGVGPGDPELMTLKAVRALARADVVAHFGKAGNGSNARTIAAAHLKPATRQFSRKSWNRDSSLRSQFIRLLSE